MINAADYVYYFKGWYESIGSRVIKPVGDANSSPSQISNAQLLQIFNRHFFILIHIQNIEERVNILLLRIEVRVQHSVCIR